MHRPRGLTLRDLFGLMIGFGLAGLMMRNHLRQGEVSAARGLLFGAAYLWLGLAMSGPFVLGFDRRGRAPLPRSPRRPGRLISDVALGMPPPAGPDVARGTYSTPELLWIGIGGFFIALAVCVSTPISSVPWTLVAILSVAILTFCSLPASRWDWRGGVANSWTHPTAIFVGWTWPMIDLLLGLSKALD